MRRFFLSVAATLLAGSLPLLLRAQTTQPSSPHLLKRQNAQDIVLQPGDDIQIAFFDTPELATHGQIAGDGTVKMPLVGDLHLGGLPTTEAARAIDEAYRAGGFVLHPQSTVSITSFAVNGVSITGEVVKPGVYPVSGHRTLLDMIALAGGLTSAADTRVTVQHADGTPENQVSLPADDAPASLKNDFSIAGGDKVLVPRAGTVYVLGEVGHPGGYLMQRNGGISVLQAIAQAQGTLHTAKTGAVVLIHKTDDSYHTERIDLHDLYRGKAGDRLLVNGDVLYVPFSNAKNFVFNAPQILGALGGAAIYSVR